MDRNDLMNTVTYELQDDPDGKRAERIMAAADEYVKTVKTENVSFYRNMVLDHMLAAGYRKDLIEQLKDPECVYEYVVALSTGKKKNGGLPIYMGQLYLLDMMCKMQNTYISLSENE